MPKMMMGQIEHARARVRAIRSALIKSAPEMPKQYTTSDLADGLRSGDIAFTGKQLQAFAQEWADEYSKSLSYSRPNFETIVTQYIYADARAAEQARYKIEKEAYDRRCAVVNAEATKVEDAIVLGDQHAALQALTEFANFDLEAALEAE